MKFIVAVLLTALIALALCMRFEWYMIALAAFITGFVIPQKHGKAALAGFLGIFLLWAILAFIIKSRGGDIIAGQVARLLPLGGNQFLLIIITGFIGGIVGASASFTGSLGRKML